MSIHVFINPRGACAARVTVLVRVCPLSEISPLERLFVLSRTQQATEIKIFVGFSLKRLRCGDPALPPLNGRLVGHFSAESARKRIIVINPRRACAARVTVVIVSVCLSVTSHLTSGASVHPENSVTNSTSNEGQNNCGDFSETALLQRYNASCVVGYCRAFKDSRTSIH